MGKISIKGDLKEGIKIVVDSSLDWEEAKSLIIEGIDSRKNFLKGVQVFVDLQEKIIDEEEWKDFQKHVFENYGIMLTKEIIRVKVSQSPSNIARVIVGPIRSGRRLSSKENLLIIGDINSGAEIFCGKSIFVLGKLRGYVYAGYENNDKAIIFALELEPERIQIANIALDKDVILDKSSLGYWIFIEDGEIKINRYLGGKKDG
ncbi:MAG TPA: septum site-determining protein MinC [Dictyoglomaceae bacterium]|nr:septum site-determining protein MinC [Dictyoglomaceae bacterium]HOL39631.1 septum site-determining protein MinC [Dictyoglomaceae bacterium]HOP95147.1 septum site-determining protein MinC [Dictyoglomaceae bacterium]HPP15203.1 septum site-determining protein MinC [Dictyoglomaceae bacterium]HPU42609.1 septum site-determining protein MinC [Dictyoglomaceae bacterium]